MTWTREGDLRFTVVLSPEDNSTLDALRDRGETRSHVVRRALRLHYALRSITHGSRLHLAHPDGSKERIVLLP